MTAEDWAQEVAEVSALRDAVKADAVAQWAASDAAVRTLTKMLRAYSAAKLLDGQSASFFDDPRIRAEGEHYIRLAEASRL